MLKSIIGRLELYKNSSFNFNDIHKAIEELMVSCKNQKLSSVKPKASGSGDLCRSNLESQVLSSSFGSVDWEDYAILYNWVEHVVKFIAKNPDYSSVRTPALLEEISELCGMLREHHKLPPLDDPVQSNQPQINHCRKALNRLVRSLTNLLAVPPMQCPCGTHDERVNLANSLSNVIGSFLLGNLPLLESDLLGDLSERLLDELKYRRDSMTAIDRSYHIYLTLSHLTFVRPVWEKTDGTASGPSGKSAHSDFLADPGLYEAFFNAFIDCLRGCDADSSKNLEPSVSDHEVLVRKTVMACFNGIAQLLNRRVPRPRHDLILLSVRVIWNHVVSLNRHFLLNRKPPRLPESSEYRPRSDLSPGSSSPGSDSNEDISASQMWLSVSSSSGQTTNLDSCNSFHVYPKLTTGDINGPQSHSGTPEFRSSSSDDDNNPPVISSSVSSATQDIAAGLLMTSCSSPHLMCYSYNHQRRGSGKPTQKPHLFSGGSVRCNRSSSSRTTVADGAKHTSTFGSQLKLYALSVFCLRRLMDGCRSQSMSDLWSVLISGDPMLSANPQYDRLPLSSHSLEHSTAATQITGRQPDLLTLLFKTSDVRIRQMLIEILIGLLCSGNKRFAIAEDLTPHSASFVPYSVRLAVELRQLHRRLLLALVSEKSIGLQALLLKALNTLVFITPYQRLRPGLLTSLLPALKQLLNLPGLSSRMVDLRAGCLSLLSNIVGKVPGPLLEVCQILSPTPEVVDCVAGAGNSTSKESGERGNLWPSHLCRSINRTVLPPDGWSNTLDQNAFTPCWLVQVCLRLIHPNVSSFAWDSKNSPDRSALYGDPDSSLNLDHPGLERPPDEVSGFHPPSVRVQALTTLRSMVPNYVGFLKPSLPLIKKTLLFCLQDTTETKLLWSPALKFLTVFLPYLMNQNAVKKDNQYSNDDADSSGLSWWRDFLPTVVHILQNAKESSDRVCCCRVVALIDDNVLRSLLQKNESMIWDVIEALKFRCSDDDETVRARAIRALGSMVVLRPLHSKLDLVCYLIHMARMAWISAQNLTIGLDIAWSLANALEVLVVYKENLKVMDGCLTQWRDVVKQVRLLGLDWTSLVETCCDLSAAQPTQPMSRSLTDLEHSHQEARTENVKGPDAHRCENGARALGYLLRLLSPGLLTKQETIKLLINSMCDAMITEKASSAEKIRWNANLAVGHLFRNIDLWEQLSRSAHAERLAGSDPLFSRETAILFRKIIEKLCHAFKGDKYFKTRVHAANSLIGLYLINPDYADHGPLAVINQTSMDNRGDLGRPVEMDILEAALHVLGHVDIIGEAEKDQTKAEHHQFSTQQHPGPVVHLSETQYRKQCVYAAATLVFRSIASLINPLHTNPKPQWPSALDTQLSSWTNPMVTAQLVYLLGRSLEEEENVLDECNRVPINSVRIFANKLDRYPPKTLIISHALELNDDTPPNKRLEESTDVFQTEFLFLRAAVDAISPNEFNSSGFLSHLYELCQAAEIDTMRHQDLSDEKPVIKLELDPNNHPAAADNTSVFRRIYD
ncbi:unnamed protein product [Calicophoron daubneyi]|uniref:HEAT repeat-containing protein 6 n=1 Tax=Calicophoron daubneyi TaxID=300641 RepID=A0AAV2SYV8_CALDB